MKKLAIIFTAISLGLALASCNGKNDKIESTISPTDPIVESKGESSIVNVVYKNGTISWNNVEGASYILKINDSVISLETNSYILSQSELQRYNGQYITISVSITKGLYQSAFTAPVSILIGDDIADEDFASFFNAAASDMYIASTLELLRNNNITKTAFLMLYDNIYSFIEIEDTKTVGAVVYFLMLREITGAYNGKYIDFGHYSNLRKYVEAHGNDIIASTGSLCKILTVLKSDSFNNAIKSLSDQELIDSVLDGTVDTKKLYSVINVLEVSLKSILPSTSEVEDIRTLLLGLKDEIFTDFPSISSYINDKYEIEMNLQNSEAIINNLADAASLLVEDLSTVIDIVDENFVADIVTASKAFDNYISDYDNVKAIISINSSKESFIINYLASRLAYSIRDVFLNSDNLDKLYDGYSKLANTIVVLPDFITNYCSYLENIKLINKDEFISLANLINSQYELTAKDLVAFSIVTKSNSELSNSEYNSKLNELKNIQYYNCFLVLKNICSVQTKDGIELTYGYMIDFLVSYLDSYPSDDSESSMLNYINKLSQISKAEYTDFITSLVAFINNAKESEAKLMINGIIDVTYSDIIKSLAVYSSYDNDNYKKLVSSLNNVLKLLTDESADALIEALNKLGDTSLNYQEISEAEQSLINDAVKELNEFLDKLLFS